MPDCSGARQSMINQHSTRPDAQSLLGKPYSKWHIVALVAVCSRPTVRPPPLAIHTAMIEWPGSAWCSGLAAHPISAPRMCQASCMAQLCMTSRLQHRFHGTLVLWAAVAQHAASLRHACATPAARPCPPFSTPPIITWTGKAVHDQVAVRTSQHSALLAGMCRASCMTRQCIEKGP